MIANLRSDLFLLSKVWNSSDSTTFAFSFLKDHRCNLSYYYFTEGTSTVFTMTESMCGGEKPLNNRTVATKSPSLLNFPARRSYSSFGSSPSESIKDEGRDPGNSVFMFNNFIIFL